MPVPLDAAVGERRDGLAELPASRAVEVAHEPVDHGPGLRGLRRHAGIEGGPGVLAHRGPVDLGRRVTGGADDGHLTDAGAERRVTDEPGIEPVSYTHLTLPTN